jgi:predicted acetyltransferase
MGRMRFRQITAAERADVMFPLLSYAFLASPWPDGDAEAYRKRMRFFETAVHLVAEEDGRALAGATALRLRQNVRGLVHDMAGVASVASDPSARRRGLVRGLIERLLPQMRDEGCAVAALYPFRPSFYGRFGFAGVPQVRTATFAPEGLAPLLRAELPGEVERVPFREGFAAYGQLIEALLRTRHGFANFDEVRAAGFREEPGWVAIARSGAEVVGAVRYKVVGYGGELAAQDLLTTGPLGRALLLRFFARHIDQVARVSVRVDADEVPELWGTDFAVQTEARVDFPQRGAPMVRVLDMPALAGTPVGDGAITVEIPEDPLIGGVWTLAAENGRLAVSKGTSPTATLTAAGLSALVYGVLDPVEVTLRGLGQVPGGAVDQLAALFPRRLPYLFAEF